MPAAHQKCLAGNFSLYHIFALSKNAKPHTTLGYYSFGFTSSTENYYFLLDTHNMQQ